MKNVMEHLGTLELVRRLPSSVNGNPRFLIRIDGHTCATTVDSSHGYHIQNDFGKQVRAHIGTHYGVSSLDNYWLS